MKISIIGAGSMFTRHLTVDILTIEGLDQGVLALVDIDPKRLELAKKLVEMIIAKTGKNWQVIASTDRREVLADSDFVINQIEVSGLETVRLDYEIPLKYGVKQCIGDTLGPGGLFKTLRTLPPWMEIVRDIEELAPKTTILNYTNPMSAVVLATTRITDLPVVGLCHSVQGSSRQLAEYLDVPYEELEWECAGINQMAWFTRLEHKGRDMYPVLKEKAKDPQLLARDPVRLDALLYLGAFVTESSGHFSEYIPYYRKRQELIDQHCGQGYNGETGFYATQWPTWRANNDRAIQELISGERELTLERSYEYAALIIEAMVKDQPAVIYGNVKNTGLIENLPQDGIVEVACMINRNGINPCYFGRLPEQLAALNRSNMAFFELAVEAVLQRDREMAMHALMVDPLTAAVCSLGEIKAMFDELYQAQRDYIPALK
ncbi:MAG TPA: alpha-galactosidase [Bacillota bacterium]|nr:alpha-galactosidase [Limnochordia bacterium]HOA36527.1 alpha-galactosidase [Bacillota bacterium]